MNNSYQPVYWLHDNIQLPNNEVEEVISEIKNSNFDLLCTRDIGTLSTYHIPFYSRPDNIWKEKYEKIFENIVKNLGLYEGINYTYDFWSQVYTKHAVHLPHHHYCKVPTISFVHFVKPTKEKCFSFLDNQGNDYVIKEQNEGDLICFPSYLWHRVKNKTDDLRFVVAGNINIVFQQDDYVFSNKRYD